MKCGEPTVHRRQRALFSPTKASEDEISVPDAKHYCKRRGFAQRVVKIGVLVTTGMTTTLLFTCIGSTDSMIQNAESPKNL